ncbi:hypothetical protein [Nocardioides albidus]|uniref:hypothetical protein n=1 Tax=Nocardioides albidus TaxID=1517589 RepID=UPI001F029578|nr:hypothetical protein [Nocardioides albidus]
MSALPASARLAWWGTAWLRGRVGPDDVLDAVQGEDVTHVVGGPDGPSSLLLELAAARNHGADQVAAAFPAPGDPAGLRGPRDLTHAAVEAGEVALLAGTGLVPRQVGRAVEWTVLPAERRPPPDLGEADRQLRSTLLTAANALADLDVARWQPRVADELLDLRAGVPLAAPPGTPRRCVDLAGRALHVEAVVELALRDDGGALSAGEALARRAALDPLERAARHALTAACSPDGWPPEPDESAHR